jgi:hypothetical protein
MRSCAVTLMISQWLYDNQRLPTFEAAFCDELLP